MKEKNLYFLLRGWLWLLRKVQPTEVQWNLVMAAGVGVMGAVLGLLFRGSTSVVQGWFMGFSGTEVPAFKILPLWARPIVPALGGLIAGLVLLLGQRYFKQKPTD